MKKYYIFSLFILLFSAVSCSDWTEPSAKNIDELLADADAAQAKAHEAYLANLRAYKKTDHQVTFGWFGGWTGEVLHHVASYNPPRQYRFRITVGVVSQTLHLHNRQI